MTARDGGRDQGEKKGHTPARGRERVGVGRREWDIGRGGRRSTRLHEKGPRITGGEERRGGGDEEKME